MAFLGTLIAFLCALPLGFLGATNVVANPFVHFGLRRLFDTLRGVDALTLGPHLHQCRGPGAVRRHPGHRG